TEEDFEARVAAADTPAALWHVVTTYFRDTEIARVIYHHLPPMGAVDGDDVRIKSYGVPADLARHYVEDKLYRDNPVLPRAMRSTEPFYIDEIAGQGDLSDAQRAFVEVARKLDLLRGLAVPVFGPNGR